MRHLILGAGNLGQDLYHQLSAERGVEVEIWGTDKFFFDATSFHPIEKVETHHADVIWCTVGSGGPTTDAKKMGEQYLAHVVLPSQLCLRFEGTNKQLVFFSTHYLNDESNALRSHYAWTKREMENLLEKNKNAHCFRVGSLYGKHRPLHTLPGKIAQRYIHGQEIRRAINVITPTPTAWLAEVLVASRFWRKPRTAMPISVGPGGYCSVGQWIEEIFLELAEHLSLNKNPPIMGGTFVDADYPILSDAKVNFNTVWWDDLWNDHKIGLMESVLRELSGQNR